MQIWSETKPVALADKRNLSFCADRKWRPTGAFSEFNMVDTKNPGMAWVEWVVWVRWVELVTLASASFWPLLIIESVARVSQHVLFTHDLLVQRHNVKGELDCFNCKAGGGGGGGGRGGFSDYSLQCLQKKAITIHVFVKKSTRLRGIFNNYKEIKN